MAKKDPHDDKDTKGGSTQYVDGDPNQGRWNTTPMATPPPDTHGVPYEQKSHYTYNHFTGESTDPRPGKGR